jgi:hypothetical protein
MEKTYILTESELQALLKEQRRICTKVRPIFFEKILNAPTPDLSHLKEAGQELEELRAWKESAMKVMPDFQEIGKLLDIPLGTSVSEQIIPKIKELKEAEQK